MSGQPKRGSSRFRRLALRIFLGCLLAFATFLVGSHALFWWALDRISTGDLRVSYERVVSLEPGVLRLRSVIITRPAEWSLTIESLDAQLAWSALLRGEPVFRSMRARSVRLALEAPSSVVAGMPSRSGFDTPRFSAASSAGTLTVPPWTVEELSATIERIEDKERRLVLTDGVLLSAHGILGSRSSLVAERAQLSLRRSRLTHEHRTLATLAGHIQAKQARIWLHGSLATSGSSEWQVKAHGASGANPQVTLRGQLRLEQGRPALPTHLTLALPERWVWRPGAFRAELSAGSTLDVIAAADGRVTGWAQFPRLRLGLAGDWPLELRAVVIERIWLRNLLRSVPGPVALRIQAEHARLETSAWPMPIESSLLARLTLLKQSSGTWSLGSSTVELLQASLAGQASPPAERAKLRLLIDSATLESGPAFALAGAIELSAPSLRSVLAPFEAPQRVQWMLGPFLPRPIQARARLSYTDVLSIRDLHAQAGALKVLGHFEQSGRTRRGAVLVSSPLTSIGLRFGGDSPAAVIRPPAGWLDRQASNPRALDK